METTQTKQIRFPVLWYGKLIAYAGIGDISSLVQEVFASTGVTETGITRDKLSAKGTYQTWQLQAMIPDLETFRELFRRLESIPGVKMLI